METPGDNYELALAGHELGFRFVPCAPGTKTPLVKWKTFQDAAPGPDLYTRWFRGTRNNIALVCGDLVVVDCDSPDVIDLVIARCGDTPHKVRTPSGGCHLGYRARPGVAVANRVKVGGRPIDLRAAGGLAVVPNSVVGGTPYEWLGPGLRPITELPFFRVAWTRERASRRSRAVITAPGFTPETRGRIRFPEAYCMKIHSIQGENGSRALVRVVCVLRDAGRAPGQIFEFVKHVWGPACCRPEWSDREILHCLDRHCATGRP